MLFLLENGLLFSARSDIFLLENGFAFFSAFPHFLLENVVLRCVPTLSYLKMACFSAVFRVRFFLLQASKATCSSSWTQPCTTPTSDCACSRNTKGRNCATSWLRKGRASVCSATRWLRSWWVICQPLVLCTWLGLLGSKSILQSSAVVLRATMRNNWDKRPADKKTRRPFSTGCTWPRADDRKALFLHERLWCAGCCFSTFRVYFEVFLFCLEFISKSTLVFFRKLLMIFLIVVTCQVSGGKIRCWCSRGHNPSAKFSKLYLTVKNVLLKKKSIVLLVVTFISFLWRRYSSKNRSSRKHSVFLMYILFSCQPKALRKGKSANLGARWFYLRFIWSWRCFSSKLMVLKVVDIDPQGSIRPSKDSINSQGVE